MSANTHIQILIAEDDHRIAIGMRDILQREFPDVTIEHVSNGVSAKEVMNNKEYSLLLTDINMPGIDGLELIAWVRENNATIPILVISGIGDQSEQVKVLDLGANDFIPKPVNPEELIARVKTNLRAADAIRLATINAEICAANEAREKIIGIIMHDMRTPLVQAEANIEDISILAIADGVVDKPRLLRISSVLSDNLKFLIELSGKVGECRAIAEIFASGEYQKVNVINMMRKVVDAYMRNINKLGLTVDWLIEDKNLMIWTDPLGFEAHLFGNLLTNAMRYTPRGGQIILGVSSHDGLMHVSVTDGGHGMSKDNIHRFLKAGGPQGDLKHHVLARVGEVSYNSGGRGLGSYAIKLALTAHDGNPKLTIESRGVCTIFAHGECPGKYGLCLKHLEQMEKDESPCCPRSIFTLDFLGGVDQG